MKLNEITDEHSPMMKWMMKNTYVGMTSNHSIPPMAGWMEDHNGVVSIDTQGAGLNINCSSSKPNPPGKIGYCDKITYHDGTMENLLPVMVESAYDLAFSRISHIDADELVNILLSLQRIPLLSWHDCSFDGSIVPIVRLGEFLAESADECYFTIEGYDEYRNEELEELVQQGWSEQMDEFEFQQLLIENGFEELT